MSEFTVSLAAARINVKLTQIEMARAIGVHPSTIKNWESGKFQPDFNQVKRISEVTHIPIDFIFLPDNLQKVENDE